MLTTLNKHRIEIFGNSVTKIATQEGGKKLIHLHHSCDTHRSYLE
jgi:hypothetical protein